MRGFVPRTTRKCPLRGFAPTRRGNSLAGFRPRTSRSFCFGKRTQNHSRPGVAQGVPLPQSRWLGLRNSLRSDSPRPHIEFAGPGRSPARRRRDVVCLSCHARPRAGIQGLCFFLRSNDTGFPLKACGNDRQRKRQKTLDPRPRSGSRAGSRKDDRQEQIPRCTRNDQSGANNSSFFYGLTLQSPLLLAISAKA